MVYKMRGQPGANLILKAKRPISLSTVNRAHNIVKKKPRLEKHQPR